MVSVALRVLLKADQELAGSVSAGLCDCEQCRLVDEHRCAAVTRVSDAP